MGLHSGRAHREMLLRYRLGYNGNLPTSASSMFACKARAITQTVSRWLPTEAVRVRSVVWSSGICGGQSGAGAGFLGVLRFSLPIFTH
jgi:hypothetical protein